MPRERASLAVISCADRLAHQAMAITMFAVVLSAHTRFLCSVREFFSVLFVSNVSFITTRWTGLSSFLLRSNIPQLLNPPPLSID